MSDVLTAHVQEYLVRQIPFDRPLSALMRLGRIRLSHQWTDRSIRGMRFQRERTGVLRLGLVRFDRDADVSFDVEPFLRERRMRHADLVELVLFMGAHGKDLPEGATVTVGDTFRLPTFDRTPWFRPRIRKVDARLLLGAIGPSHNMHARDHLLAAFMN